ncbi:MAG: RHS Repeat protein [Nitrospira sp. OLB3]|nr:MAG: RHS Repeat protein [Nitrospira sp. OLB3]
MGDTISSGRWRRSINGSAPLSETSVSITCRRLSFCRGGCCAAAARLLLSIVTLLCLGLVEEGLSGELSDREEDGLVGPVRSVETKESLLVQIDRYDAQGRVVERMQGGLDTMPGLWPLRFSYHYDQTGRLQSEVVTDAKGDLVKETRMAYDARGHRSAEVAAWGDGTFENASLYEYDQAGLKIRGLHYNAVQVINRNLFTYDEHGRVIGERFERNYRYDAVGNQVATSDRFDAGHALVLTYDDQGRVGTKHVSDLRGRREGRSEFRYDDHGNQIEEAFYDALGRLTDRKTYRYDYDAVGNWTKETFERWESVDGGERLKQAHVRERTIVYHDATCKFSPSPSPTPVERR